MSSLSDAHSDVSDAWKGRPVTAASIRHAAAIGPLAISTALVWFCSTQFIPADAPLATIVACWIGLSAAASGLLLVLDRAFRRLLPLAALLDLSLVFPDQAPSRFRTAMGTLSTTALERELEGARTPESATTPAEVAERLLQFVAALGKHDSVTRGHSERVRAYSQIIAGEMGLSRCDRDRLNWAALIHDVGKLSVPAEILNTKGTPTAEEFELIRHHAEEGARLVEPLREWLGDWCDAVVDHHEKYDGTGYPNGLAGDEISLGGRIVAVADVFDVLTSARSYKAANSFAAARSELVSCTGSHFDPLVVRAFLCLSIGRLRLAAGPLAWLAHLPFIARAPVVPALGKGAAAASVAVVGLFVVPVGDMSLAQAATGQVRERVAAPFSTEPWGGELGEAPTADAIVRGVTGPRGAACPADESSMPAGVAEMPVGARHGLALESVQPAEPPRGQTPGDDALAPPTSMPGEEPGDTADEGEDLTAPGKRAKGHSKGAGRENSHAKGVGSGVSAPTGADGSTPSPKGGAKGGTKDAPHRPASKALDKTAAPPNPDASQNNERPGGRSSPTPTASAEKNTDAPSVAAGPAKGAPSEVAPQPGTGRTSGGNSSTGSSGKARASKE